MHLHGYYRSSAAWRVRIALGLKQRPVAHVFHHLRRAEHLAPAYRALNPQALLPTLQLEDGTALTQSLAICEWLDETTPTPPLLPGDALQRARIRAFSLAIAADTHPLQNLRILARLRAAGLPEDAVTTWAREIIADGLAACEALVANTPGPFCFGPTPTLAECCLIPQLFNARRFGVALDALPRLLAAEAACAPIEAFRAAAAENQPDAE